MQNQEFLLDQKQLGNAQDDIRSKSNVNQDDCGKIQDLFNVPSDLSNDCQLTTNDAFLEILQDFIQQELMQNFIDFPVKRTFRQLVDDFGKQCGYTSLQFQAISKMLCVMFRESIRVNLLCFIEVFQYEIIKLYFRRKKYHKFLITQTVKDHIDRYKSKLILDEQFDVGSTEYLMEQKDDTTILLLKPYKYNSNCQDICDVYGVEHLFRFCYYIKEEFARCKTRSKYEESNAINQQDDNRKQQQIKDILNDCIFHHLQGTYCPKGPDLAGDDIFHGFIQFGNLIDLLIKYIHSLSLRSIRNTRVTAKVVMMEGLKCPITISLRIIWLGSIAGMQQTMSVVRKIAQQWRYGKDNVDSNMYPIPPQISKEHEISNKELISNNVRQTLLNGDLQNKTFDLQGHQYNSSYQSSYSLPPGESSITQSSYISRFNQFGKNSQFQSSIYNSQSHDKFSSIISAYDVPNILSPSFYCNSSCLKDGIELMTNL